jgi:hypothetical protein
MFGGMLALMALRVPIAAAMFIPGAVGYWLHVQRGGPPQPDQGQCGGAADGLRPVGDPAVPADGAVRHPGGAEPRPVPAPPPPGSDTSAAGWAWPRCWPRVPSGRCVRSSVATSATITQVAYPEMKAHGYHGPAVHGGAGHRRYAGHPDPAVGAAGGLCHPHRAEHRQAVCCGGGARAAGHVGLHRGAGPDLPVGRNWRRPPSQCPGPALEGAAGHLAHRGDLPHGVRRHLRRPVLAHRRRGRRRHRPPLRPGAA